MVEELLQQMAAEQKVAAAQKVAGRRNAKAEVRQIAQTTARLGSDAAVLVSGQEQGGTMQGHVQIKVGLKMQENLCFVFYVGQSCNLLEAAGFGDQNFHHLVA